MQIVILGMHRSGTSCLSGLINMMGVYLGPENKAMSPGSDNQKGFWERTDVMEVNDEILSAGGATWDCVSSFDIKKIPDEQTVNLQKKIGHITQELNEHKPWFLKDPRMCLTLPLWKPFFESPAYIFVYRNPVQIAQSLAKRDKIPLHIGIALWEYYLISARTNISGENILLSCYENLILNPVDELRRLHNQLCEYGVKGLVFPDEEKIRAFVDPDMFKMRGDVNLFSFYLNSRQLELLDFLENDFCVDFTKELTISESCTKALEHFQEVCVLSRHNNEQAKAIAEQAVTIKEQLNLLTEKKNQIEKLSAYTDTLRQQNKEYDQLMINITTSVSFRIGRAITYPIRKLLVRFLLPHVHRNERVLLLTNLTRTLLTSPIQVLRTLNFQRIKNLFILLFKRPELSSQVLTNYENLINEKKEISCYKLDDDLEKHIRKQPIIIESSEVPFVSIIIPVFNQVNHTLNCLKSIEKFSPEVPFEVIVIDDCSTDQTEGKLKYVKGIIYQKNLENIGFLKSCNLAAGIAKGDYIFFLNNDTMVTAGWLDSLLEVFKVHSDAGIVGSRLIYPGGTLQEAGGIIWSDASGWNYGRNDDPKKPEYNYLKEVDYISGAAIMISRQLFVALGQFDERYVPAYYEDTDLAFEVRRAGKKVYLQPRSNIVHFEGASNGTDTSQGIKKHQTINQKKFLQKWKYDLSQSHFPNARNLFLARDRSQAKTTVLVIDHYVPTFDKDAGSRSTYLYLKLLVEQEFNVKFMGDNFYKSEPYTSTLQNMGIEVLYGDYYNKHWKSWLKDNAKNIDVIYIHRPHIATKYIDFINQLSKKPKTIYFGHDLHYLRLQRQCQIDNDKKNLDTVNEWKKLEYSLFEKFDMVYYPSQFEVDEIKKTIPHLNVKAIPLYVLDNPKQKEYNFADREGLLFVGGFNHSPNVDAISWFCEDILPIIKKKLPDITLNIVGSNTPDLIKSLASKTVKVHGYLADNALDQLYKSTRLCVVPLRYGAGIKGKILDAMHKGIPVVTTKIGAEGIPSNPECLIVKNDAVDMAKSIISLYQGDSEAKKMVENSNKVIQKYFSREAVLEIIKNDFRLH